MTKVKAEKKRESMRQSKSKTFFSIRKNKHLSRPEYRAPPEIFYNETEARKYTLNSRMIDIQVKMCERAIELLTLPKDQSCLLLDIGCGSGLSGSVLEDKGHILVGMDISKAMLEVAIESKVKGNLILADMGEGVPFRAGVFDGAVSISALQWLCNAYKTLHKPVERLHTFFSTLYASLSRSARAVFQFYPDSSGQVEFIKQQAMRAGFYGGIVVDNPNSTKAEKYYLVLMTGGNMPLPKALETESNDAKGKSLKKSRDWILKKKNRSRRQGKDVRADSKYSGRKRS